MRESALITLAAADVDAMRAVGASLADTLVGIEPPFVIALEGELGAGKTTLVGGVLRRLGFGGHARSPTYTLIEPYELAGRSVFHLDLYRLTDPREVDALGLRDMLQPRTVLLIEWPEKGAGALPANDLSIRIRYAGQGREIELRGDSTLGQSVLQRLLAAAKP